MPTMGITGSVSNLVLTTSVTLTNAQIKALRATPVTLVPAPGAGRANLFLGAVLRLNAGANVLSESTANLAVKYTDGSGAQVSDTIEMTGFIDQEADTLTASRPKIGQIVVSTGAANKALVLHNLGAGEFGDNAAADATLNVVTLYTIVNLA
jgi:hypothetical protein